MSVLFAGIRRHRLEVITLTYRDAVIDDQVPYLSIRLAPMRPVVFMGRSAKRAPRVPAARCEWDWMQDLPVCVRVCHFISGVCSPLLVCKRSWIVFLLCTSCAVSITAFVCVWLLHIAACL